MVGAGVAVGLFVGLGDGVAPFGVGVYDFVGDGVQDGDGVLVAVPVLVAVGVFVAVGVSVAV